MTTQSTSISTGQTRQGRSRWAVGALAALTLAVGVTIWQMRGQETADPVASVPATQEQSTSATAPTAAQPTTVYLIVATADDVPGVRARLVELNRLRESNGASALDGAILVTETDAAVAQLERTITGLAGIREAEGLPPIQIIDQRTDREGVAPSGGLVEQRTSATAATEVTTRGGMGERYAEQAPFAVTTPVTTLGGMAELHSEHQVAARAAVAQLERMGGMAELYRDQAAALSPR